jgi:hypothetical protein
MSGAESSRRFSVRFLGRRRFWIALGVAALGAFVAWRFVALPARRSAEAMRSWNTLSGLGLLVLFVATCAYSIRKASLRLRAAREIGMWSREARADLRRSRRDDRLELSTRRKTALAGLSLFKRNDLVKIVRTWRADRRELEKRAVLHRKRLHVTIHDDLDRMWSGLNEINRKIAARQLVAPGDILAQARAVLAAHHVEGIRRVELVELRAPTGDAVRSVVAHHREPFGRLEAWLELHASLGAVACLGVLLHADFVVRSPLGVAMTALAAIVLVSGVAGLLLYRVAPARLAKEDFGIPYEEAGTVLADWSAALAVVERKLPQPLRERLARFLPAGPAGRMLEVKEFLKSEPAETAAAARDVLVLAGTRAALLRATHPSRRIDLWLHVWKWVHVPLSIVLLALVAVHLLQVGWF